MSWFQMMATAADAGTQHINYQSAASTDDCDTFILQWNGLQASFFDGYEYTDGPDQVTQFTADTTDWPNRVQWGGKIRGYGNPPAIFRLSTA